MKYVITKRISDELLMYLYEKKRSTPLNWGFTNSIGTAKKFGDKKSPDFVSAWAWATAEGRKAEIKEISDE